MIISKILKKYSVKDFVFVTYDNGEQLLVVNEDPLNPIDVKTGKVVNCFGTDFRIYLENCVPINEKEISILKARRIARHHKLFKKYALYVEKVKERLASQT